MAGSVYPERKRTHDERISTDGTPMLAELFPTLQGEFSLDALLVSDPPRRWLPALPNETLKGDVAAVWETVEPYGVVPNVMLTTKDGTQWVIRGTSQMLARAIYEQNPRPGDRMGFRFDGTGIGQSTGRVYKRYTVRTRYRLSTGDLGDYPDDTGE